MHSDEYMPEYLPHAEIDTVTLYCLTFHVCIATEFIDGHVTLFGKTDAGMHALYPYVPNTYLVYFSSLATSTNVVLLCIDGVHISYTSFISPFNHGEEKTSASLKQIGKSIFKLYRG